MTDREVPVLIVGGGGAGLTASMLLAREGVGHLLVNARAGTSDLPKAHVLNQRTMEILEDVGVAGEITRRGTPAANMAATGFYIGLAGASAEYGRRIMRLECWGAGGEDEHWRAASPWVQQNLPQIRLEPLLRARAEELSPGSVRFHHEVVSLEQDDTGVSCVVRDHDTASEYRVRSEYLIGADGGRLVAREIGVEYEGLGVVTQTATLHVSADFSRWARDPDVLLRWMVSPRTGAPVVMVPMGPDHWGPDSEEWVIHLNYAVDNPRARSDELVESDVREALGIGDLPMRIHKITRWSVDAVMASSFSVGRVHLVGDAAHRHPPTGGLGLASAIQDVANLSWKLTAVLAGHAGSELLQTYEAERRPVDERNAQRSLENALSHLAFGEALGISHENSEQVNLEQVRRLWSGRPQDADYRSSVLRVIRARSMEFSELNVELGFCYRSTAVVDDGSPAPRVPDTIRIYRASTHPGCPLPHAWIDDEDGRRRAIRELVGPGELLLIAGEDGAAWCEAAGEIAEAHRIPLRAVRIGHLDGDLFDPRCTWLRHREIAPDGAILVRPDRHIGWRSIGASERPTEELSGALSQLLARELGAPLLPR